MKKSKFIQMSTRGCEIRRMSKKQMMRVTKSNLVDFIEELTDEIESREVQREVQEEIQYEKFVERARTDIGKKVGEEVTKLEADRKLTRAEIDRLRDSLTRCMMTMHGIMDGFFHGCGLKIKHTWGKEA